METTRRSGHDETPAPPVTGAGMFIDPHATPDDLLNAATEWLQYARGTTALIAALIGDIEMQDVVHYPRLIIALEGISAMTTLGVQCAAQAHSTLRWEQARESGRA